MGKIYFEDLAEGKCLNCSPVLITKQAIVEFARAYDPQPFHTDEKAAENSIFKGLVASSLHILSACTRVVVQAQGNLAVLSGIGMDEVIMYHPVRPGDTIRVTAVWADLKRSGSKPDRGFASVKCRVENQNQDAILTYGYRYIVACRALPIEEGQI